MNSFFVLFLCRKDIFRADHRLSQYGSGFGSSEAGYTMIVIRGESDNHLFERIF